jgi:probable rRNA maturation factor
MLEVEVFGTRLAPDAPALSEIRRLCTLAASSRGVSEGHVAVQFVDPERITQLNAEHRHLAEPTDVLSFPIDAVEPQPALARGGGPGTASRAAIPQRELGDIVICAEQTTDLREAIVHGMLHLLGMDHETDDGHMLALQRELLRGEAG